LDEVNGDATWIRMWWGQVSRWRRVEESHNGSRDFMVCRADGSDYSRIFGQE